MSDSYAIIERIYDHVEAGDIDKAVFACLRLARREADPFNAVWFLREMGTYKRDLARELQPLKKESAKFIWERTAEEWMQERRVVPQDSSDDRIVIGSIGDLQREVVQLQHSIEDLQLPDGMGEFDTAAFTDRHTAHKLELRLQIRHTTNIIERIRARCLSYASRIETQLSLQQRKSNLVENLQNDVDNYFASRSPSAHAKLVKASGLAGSTDSEDHSLLLTSLRRAVKAVADHFFPASDEAVICADGKTRTLSDDAYLNRLNEFCATLGSGSSARLLRAEMDYLTLIVRRLNDVASKGVHAEVSLAEARQGLLTLYTFLSNLIAKVP